MVFMGGAGDASSEWFKVDVVLVGSPKTPYEVASVPAESIIDDEVCIAEGDGYDHFRLVGDSLPVFFRFATHTRARP
jgi:hypothetical protein